MTGIFYVCTCGCTYSHADVWLGRLALRQLVLFFERRGGPQRAHLPRPMRQTLALPGQRQTSQSGASHIERATIARRYTCTQLDVSRNKYSLLTRSLAQPLANCYQPQLSRVVSSRHSACQSPSLLETIIRVHESTSLARIPRRPDEQIRLPIVWSQNGPEAQGLTIDTMPVDAVRSL